MAADPNALEQAVSRTLRDNLERIQRTADELHQAINDLAAACASSRASNTLPPMVRAQTSAAALSATLEVLSRFVTGSLQTPARLPFEPNAFRIPSLVVPPPPVNAFEQPALPQPHPTTEIHLTPPMPVAPVTPAAEIPPSMEEPQAVAEKQPALEAPGFSEVLAAIEPPSVSSPAFSMDPLPELNLEIPTEASVTAKPLAQVEPAEAEAIFNLDLLPPEEQELHRRAYRVAKVSMQDIGMLRPEDVRLGRENKDLCIRLRDDIEKAHKEYDRRFQAIQSHPVDYFYDWMVEILGGGDPQTLGEYPYRTAILHR
jgi:hypothetical protein